MEHKPTSFRLHPATVTLLGGLRDVMGISRSAIIETALYDLANVVADDNRYRKRATLRRLIEAVDAGSGATN